MCAFVYALLVDRVERRVQSDREALIVAVAMGAKADIPEVDAELDAFTERLFSEPEAVDPKRQRLLAALGVA